MPPEGGDLFIDDDDDASRGVGEALVAYGPSPNEHVCEGDGSTCSDPHTEHSKFHEPKHHWLDNSLVSKPKP